MLAWTMPRRNTDKLLLKEKIAVRVCRQTAQSACLTAGPDQQLEPSTAGSFTEILPAELASGEARALSYYVELKNARGRAAGLSNAAVVLAGSAPAPVEGLRAEVRKEGVALRWEGDSVVNLSSAVRLHRTLLDPPAAASKDQNSLLAPPPESTEQSLLVEASGAGRALDSGVHFGRSYSYRAQRVARVPVAGRMFELNGELSAPVRVEVKDVFPPAVPAGLAAVASSSESGVFIDLGWQPDTEADLAGYVVYRRQDDGEWKRLTDKPSVAPAFHDADVQPGQSYRYAVSATDQSGMESARSAETSESVPER